jgi:hypothetical protein
MPERGVTSERRRWHHRVRRGVIRAMPIRQSSLIALLMTAVAAAPASAQTTAPATPSGSHLTVDACSVRSRSVLRDTLHSIPQLVVEGVTVRFTDDALVGATEVDIDVRYGGLTKSIVERGDFAPHVTVERKSTVFGGYDYAGPTATCAIRSARFSDGTSWGS